MAATATAVAKWILVSVPPIVVAVLTFQHLNKESGPFMEPNMARCGAEAKSIANPVLQFYFFFNCFIVPFFLEVVRTSEGFFIWANFAALGAVCGAFTGVESSRFGARIPMSWQAVFTFIFMFIGVSIGFPLLWLPLYFALGMPSTFANPDNLKISAVRVWAMCAFNVLFFGFGIGALYSWPEQSTLENVIKLSVWVPIFAPLVWLAFPVSRTANAEKGKDAVIQMHAFTAGLNVTCYVAMVLYLLTHQEVIWRLKDLFHSHEGGASCIYFLMIDLLVFWAAMVYQVLVESGPLWALTVIVAAPFAGPGAPLCFYYIHRESLVWNRLKAVKSKKLK